MTKPAESIGDIVTRALDAYSDLEILGEEIDDEWSYVTELEAAWRARLEDVAAAAPGRTVPIRASVAVDRAIDEIGRIRDPHRAIDWLSTFPMVVLLAIGERP